jgi:hypothetical protein
VGARDVQTGDGDQTRASDWSIGGGGVEVGERYDGIRFAWDGLAGISWTGEARGTKPQVSKPSRCCGELVVSSSAHARIGGVEQVTCVGLSGQDRGSGHPFDWWERRMGFWWEGGVTTIGLAAGSSG